ncbi:MAG: carbohydrate ABC transporter permease [Bifidobacteriaceae bacterium]|jgi:raffinose/stachyose/melibiose transport system permease protein|nr:carbohydrate ABC transporter permease [Bifidobacteriaceae bacterium]
MIASPRWIGLRYALLVGFALMILTPFVSLVLASFHESGSAVTGLSIPETWHWKNFRLAWEQGGYSNLMRSSFIISVGVVPLVAICATLASYAIAVLKVWGGRNLSLVFVLGLTLPVEMVAVALYFNLRNVGMTDSYLSVILAEAGLFLPFSIYWMQAHFSSLPEELVEAARIDGAPNLAILTRILLPVSWPAITTMAVLVFMWSWNQFLLVIVLMQTPSMRTSPGGLGFFVGQYSTNVPLLAAATIITVLPIVVVYLVFQRNFVSGLTQGAVK